MQFTVRDWMIDLVVLVNPESTVSEALAMMRRRYINSVIVEKSDANPEYGILTSTDISDKIVAAGRNPSKIKVKEIMTTPILPALAGWSLKECAEVMKEKHIHHMPVMNEKGVLVGMISATDFLVVAEAMGREPGERIS